jgi:hypothetical protein
MEYLLKINNSRIILNVQHSKIGGSYPRLFVEISEEEYINIDLTLGAAFKMYKKDFNDWLQDSIEVKDDEVKKTLEEYHINYEALLQVITDMKKEKELVEQT